MNLPKPKAWICRACGKRFKGQQAPKECSKCGNTVFVGDQWPQIPEGKRLLMAVHKTEAVVVILIAAVLIISLGSKYGTLSVEETIGALLLLIVGFFGINYFTKKRK